MEAACLYEEISISVKQFKQAYIHAEGKDYHLSRKGEKYFSKESENSCCHKETEHNKSKNIYCLREKPSIFGLFRSDVQRGKSI